MPSTNSTALIVEGGAMRSIFSAGVLDGFIENEFNPFDFYIGVSAGAYNLVAYLNSKQNRSLGIFEGVAASKEFINFRRFLTGGHLIDLDWVMRYAFDTSIIDLDSVFRWGKPLFVCMTDVKTGRPVYINTTPENIKDVIKASAALPLLYRDFPKINGREMTDGGVSEGIPVAEAIRIGATKIMVIRARHRHYIKEDTLGHKFIRWKMKNNPGLLATMRDRANIFKRSMALIRNPPPGIRIIEVFPPTHYTMGRFCRNREQLVNGYRIGFESANNTIDQWLRSD